MDPSSFLSQGRGSARIPMGSALATGLDPALRHTCKTTWISRPSGVMSAYSGKAKPYEPVYSSQSFNRTLRCYLALSCSPCLVDRMLENIGNRFQNPVSPNSI
jgi:hypothetical protein